jgi:hypothetical protein
MTASNGNGVFMRGSSSGFIITHGGVMSSAAIGSTLYAVNNLYLQLYSYDQVTLNHMIVNLTTGKSASQSVAETGALATANGPRVAVKGASEALQGNVFGVAWVRGAWTMNEMEILARNATGIWAPAPARRRIAYVPTGGGGITGDSSAAIPLTGTASGSVGVTGSSSAPIPLIGVAAGSVAVNADSASPVPVTGSATAIVAIDAASSAAIPIAGASTGSVAVAASSSQPIPITGAASASSAFTANSNAPVPITGSASVSIEVHAASSAAIPIAGAASLTVGVTAVSIGAIPITGIAEGTAATGFDPSTLASAPHYIVFDALDTSLDFDELATWIDFGELAIRTIFLSPQGVELMGDLKLIEGEVRDVEYVVRGAAGVPLDLTNSVTRKLTVRVPGQTPRVDQVDVTIVGTASDGRLKLAANVDIAGVAGRYKALTVVTYPGGVIVKSPGEVLVESAIA